MTIKFEDKDSLFERIQRNIQDGVRDYKATLEAPAPGSERALREWLDGYLGGPPAGAVQLSQFVSDWCEQQHDVLESTLLSFSSILNSIEYQTDSLLEIIKPGLPDVTYLMKLQETLKSNDAQWLSLQDTGDVYGWPTELEAA